MEIPILTRQVAETLPQVRQMPLLRQFSIPLGIEDEPSPKPDNLEPDYTTELDQS